MCVYIYIYIYTYIHIYIYVIFLYAHDINQHKPTPQNLKCQKLVCLRLVEKNRICVLVFIKFRLSFRQDRLHCRITWVSKEKGCSPPRASKSSVLSISDSWSPPQSARPHSPQSPHSAGPPVRITSHLWIFHYMFFSKSASKLGISSAHALFLSCVFSVSIVTCIIYNWRQ